VTADPALEIWAAPRRAELLERVLGVKIKVEAGPVQEDPAATTSTDDAALVLAPLPATEP
jgi:hypothetical protein